MRKGVGHQSRSGKALVIGIEGKAERAAAEAACSLDVSGTTGVAAEKLIFYFELRTWKSTSKAAECPLYTAAFTSDYLMLMVRTCAPATT